MAQPYASMYPVVMGRESQRGWDSGEPRANSLEWVLKTMRVYWTPWLGVGRTNLKVEKLKARAGGDWLGLENMAGGAKL